jgi:hypothetical protein
MSSLQIRGERQWAAAVRRAATVKELRVHGPESLSLEGIELMTSLRDVSFLRGSPTDQLYRLAALESLDYVGVQLGAAHTTQPRCSRAGSTRLSRPPSTRGEALSSGDSPMTAWRA